MTSTTYRVGDPDPTPFGSAYTPCLDVLSDAPRVGFPDGLLCTLPTGHTGQHIAGCGHAIVAVWE